MAKEYVPRKESRPRWFTFVMKKLHSSATRPVDRLPAALDEALVLPLRLGNEPVYPPDPRFRLRLRSRVNVAVA
jgi:hypothetical protein